MFSLCEDYVFSVILFAMHFTDVLMYHIVPGAYFSEGLRDGMWLPTLAQEQELLMRVTSDGYSRKWLCSVFKTLILTEFTELIDIDFMELWKYCKFLGSCSQMAGVVEGLAHLNFANTEQ